MATLNVETPGSNDLATFQLTMQQQEEILGPLTALSANGADNIMTFETSSAPPTNATVLQTYEGATPPPLDGNTLIASYPKCLVSGAVTPIAAYRPT